LNCEEDEHYPIAATTIHQMNPTHLLYLASGNDDFSPGDESCTLCASPHRAEDSTPLESVLSDTFTDHGMCRAPHSRSVCPACAYYFLHRWDSGQKYPTEFRKRSLLVTRKAWRNWKREDMRQDIEGWLAHGLPEDSVLVISLAKKKHLLPLAPVNPTGSKRFALTLENQRVRVEPYTWRFVSSSFDVLLSIGCTKGEIITGTCDPRTLARVDLTTWQEHDRLLSVYRPSSLLELVSYVTITGGNDLDSAEPPDA
jgi:hypothetical protein